MQITITGKQLHLGDNMQAYVEKNLSAVVEKYFDDAVNASALFSKEGDLIKAEVSVHPVSGALLKGSAQGSDLMLLLIKHVNVFQRNCVNTKIVWQNIKTKSSKWLMFPLSKTKMMKN